jgi:hypothetical protein
MANHTSSGVTTRVTSVDPEIVAGGGALDQPGDGANSWLGSHTSTAGTRPMMGSTISTPSAR